MDSYDLKGFIKYIKVAPSKSKDIYIANFDDFPNIPLKSEPFQLDFFVFSLEYDVDANFDERLPEVIDYSCYVYYDRPGSILEWDLNVLCKGYFLLLSAECFNQFVDKDSFVNHHGNRVYLNNEEKLVLLDIFQKADEEYQKDNFSKEIMVSYAFLLLSHIKTFYQRFAKGRNLKHHKLVDGFNLMLSKYYEDDKLVKGLPSVSFFANELNCSTNHFGDVIKKHTGVSPREHVNKHILRVAKRRLKQSDKTIEEIATGLGFQYQTYFTRFFKSKTGITPTDYRKQ